MDKKHTLLLILLNIFFSSFLIAEGQIEDEVEPVVNTDSFSKSKSGTSEIKEIPMTPEAYNDYRKAINNTAQMVSDEKAQHLAAGHGLDIVNVTWEDTGRFYDSAVGPNISDMTIQVALKDINDPEIVEVTAMPVIRYPNYDDLSTDLDPGDFTLLTGNQKGNDLKRISLYQFLKNPRDYLSDSSSWKGSVSSLLAPRDSKVLVSAQACFLPIPQGGKAIFNPLLFNYQSYDKNPAVLTVLATREGTSVTIIDNTRDSFEGGYYWGQRLFHNRNGEKASLTGQRESDFQVENNESGESSAIVEDENGLNMVLLIQIPLKQKSRPQTFFGGYETEGLMLMESASAPVMDSDVENAVIGSGPVEGPFIEIDGLRIKRDPDFPVRVTVQFYKATSNGIVSEQDMDDIAKQIKMVYARGDYVSSLVTGGGTGRITEYDGVKIQPENWWRDFWKRFENEKGISREEAIERLEELLGVDYEKREISELYIRDLLRD